MPTETLYLHSTPEEMTEVEKSLKENARHFLAPDYLTSFKSQYDSENPLDLDLSRPSDPPERKLSSVEITITRNGISSQKILTEDELDDKVFSLILAIMSKHEDIEYFSFLE